VTEKNEVFLMDANSFIAPYRQYYPFDMVPGFWSHIKECIGNGSIVIARKVFDEVMSGGDDLSNWVDQFRSKTLDHRDKNIVIACGKILDYLRTSHKYNDEAAYAWSGNKIADPWLIATAHVYGQTVVTFEKSSNSPNKPKIPDICERFGVKHCSLFQMMRTLGFSLSK